jgi:hypothetical protein
VSGDRVRCAEALSEDAAEVEDETQCEPRVREPEPLEGCLRKDERFRLFECDNVGRAGKPVEESDFTEQIAGLERAHALRAFVGRHENLERAARDDEEAAVELSWTAKSPGLYRRACVY